MFSRVNGTNPYSPEFQAHTDRVFGSMDMTVGLMDDEDALIAQLAHVKDQHATRNMKPEYYAVSRLFIPIKICFQISKDKQNGLQSVFTSPEIIGLETRQTAMRPKKKFDVFGYIGQKIRVGRSANNFFPNFFYCTDSGQNKHVRSLIHKTAVNQCNLKKDQTMIKFLGSAVKI
jgi:hypothetical protein